MIKNGYRFLTLLLCLTMIIGLCACSDKNDSSTPNGGSSDSNGAETNSGAMGRYVEQEEYLPEEIKSVITMSQMSDTSLRLLGDLGDQGVGPYGVYSSSDGGKSWEPVNYPWLDQLYGCPIYTAALTPDGAYVSHGENLLAELLSNDASGESAENAADAGEDGAKTAATETAADSEGEGDTVTSDADIGTDYTFVYGDESGVTEIPFDYTSEVETAMSTTLYAAGNGDLLSVGLTGEILQIDTKNWKVKNTYMGFAGVAIAPGVAANGNTLAVNSTDKITLYDMDSGSSINEINADGSMRGGSTMPRISTAYIPPDGSAAFYANDEGIYRVPIDSTESERLVDGGLSSLGVQTLSFTNVFSVGNDEYLALAKTSEFLSRLYRYTYDPNIPAEPSQTLNVYSLYDNKTIRQAISGFQTRNPDVRVNYQVGLSEGSAVTAADAIRTLSTELLAGKGPDVIVMDDMDIDGYIQKNILQDITDVVSNTDTLSNITKAFNQDGKLYAVPARFYVPMLLGDGIENVKDLSDFTSWLDTQYTYDIGTHFEDLVANFYSVCSHRWFAEDGSLDEASFRTDLEQLGKLAEGIRGLDEVNSISNGNNAAIDTLLWYGGAIAANYGVATGYVDMALFEAAIKNRPSSSYHPFPSDVFIPGTILGVNTATGLLDTAKSFIQHVLSDEVQATSLGDGFPVNSAAFEHLSKNPNPGQESINAAIAVNDARTGELTEVSLSGDWPSDEFMTGLKNMLRGAQVPVKSNAVIREMIFDETSGFISGTKSLDDTIRSFKQKMDLYISE